MKKLNLGCGKDYKRGWINVDCRKNVRADFVCNLEKIPYPFKNNEFDFILMDMVLEHLSNPINILKELIRISKNRAIIRIIVPHATSYSALSDLQHKNKFNEHTFSKNHLEEYELDELKLIRKKFIFINKWKGFVPFKNFLKIFINGLYDDMLFEFRIIKNKAKND